MAYSTVSNIQDEFKSVTFSASSTPTDTAVGRFITEADAEIDARIGLRYDTPVTGANSIIILRQISIGLVAQRVKDILRITTGSASAEQLHRDRDLAKEARKKLDDIVDGKLLLSDATAASSGQGVYSFNVANEEEHTFEKGVDQW
jgi:hypothetical protein